MSILATTAPPSYSKFSYDEVRLRFELTVHFGFLFEQVEPIQPSEILQAALQRAQFMPLVSEKARSESLVSPVLLEVAAIVENTISIYSGVRLDVSPEEGLQGVCDFIVSNSPPFPAPHAPLLLLVEAKKNDIESGLGQCLAAMIAAQRYNQTHGQAIPIVYGCVTTGIEWQFLQLQAHNVRLEPKRMHINQVDLILSKLVNMVPL